MVEISKWCGHRRHSGKGLWTRQRITVWQCELEEEVYHHLKRSGSGSLEAEKGRGQGFEDTRRSALGDVSKGGGLMNELEAQGEKVQWGDSEVDLPSDCYSSDSDESDAEVPDVTDPFATSSNGGALPRVATTENKALNLTSVSGSTNSVASNCGKGNGKEIDIGRGWKPVIGGKLQGLEESAPMQAANGGPVSSSPSSKQQTSSEKSKSPPAANPAADKLKKDGNESDSDVRRVPEMSVKGGGSGAGSSHTQDKSSAGPPQRKRGGASADKEHKRLKRLLRNRVSAQQARERKKAYLSDLEVRSKELEHRNAELEERVSTLQRENQMLRQIVKNTALKKTGPGGSPAGGAQ